MLCCCSLPADIVCKLTQNITRTLRSIADGSVSEHDLRLVRAYSKIMCFVVHHLNAIAPHSQCVPSQPLILNSESCFSWISVNAWRDHMLCATSTYSIRFNGIISNRMEFALTLRIFGPWQCKSKNQNKFSSRCRTSISDFLIKSEVLFFRSKFIQKDFHRRELQDKQLLKRTHHWTRVKRIHFGCK